MSTKHNVLNAPNKHQLNQWLVNNARSVDGMHIDHVANLATLALGFLVTKHNINNSKLATGLDIKLRYLEPPKQCKVEVVTETPDAELRLSRIEEKLAQLAEAIIEQHNEWGTKAPDNVLEMRRH